MGRGENFFPEDGFFFAKDDFSAAEDGFFFAEGECSAARDGFFFPEDACSAAGDGFFFPEDECSAAGEGVFFAEDEYSAAEDSFFFTEDEYSAAKDGFFFTEKRSSGEKNGAVEPPGGGTGPVEEPFTPEGGLMAQWSSGATWSSGVLWGSASPPLPTFENTRQRRQPTMKRQPYYPKKTGDQAEWHTNFATKLPGYASTLGLIQAEEDNAVADNLILAYGLGGWILAVREHGTACTQSLDTLSYGTGSTNFAFPTAQLPPLPTLPAGITGVKPGALQRTFDLVGILKRKPGYTEAIGLDLGIVGSEAPEPPPSATPRIKVVAELGQDCECARVTFFKDGHQGIILETRRGGSAWEELAIATKSPYLDERPLLVPTQAEVREYRARFWDDGRGNGDWCDVARVTISP